MWGFSSVQFSHSVVLTLCNPMSGSTPGLPVHHQLPESTPTHVHWVSDSIQSSHPLLSPSPRAFNLSQHQGLFQWVSSSQVSAEYHTFLISLFLVCAEEHVLGIINLLSSLGRMWISFHYCFIVWGHAWCFCCMVLLLSKPAFLSDR